MSTTYEPLETIDPVEIDLTDHVDADAVARPPAASERVRRTDDPRWVRPAFFTLLGLTAILYVWGLGASGWANAYYSAAVQAGTKSWKAFLFGSTDASSFITVDKTPASLWPMEISARIFGVNAWSILVPQAIEGVAAVALLYAAVKRWFGAVAGLLAGLVLAMTPVAALMFRFNNPDALLTLCMVAAAWAITRALDDGRTRWLVLCGALLGFGFLAKELQVFLVAPGIGLAYLFAGPPKLGKRIVQLCALVASLVVAAGWWITIVQLTPASARPYIGGSQNNSFWNVLFGYNGFGRLTGNETGSVGGQRGPGGNAMWGPTGWTRMFNSQFGTQISWLLPAALVLLVAGVVWSARRARTDRLRAALIVWGGWLLVTGLAFSFGQGIIHEYYSVALAPAIGAIVGIVGTQLWRHRDSLFARVSLAVALAATMWWTGRLLSRSPQWFAGLHTPLVWIGFGLALALVFVSTAPGRRWLVSLVAIGALAVGLAAPAAATITTVKTPHTGSIPLAGPSTTGTAGNRGFGPMAGNRGPGGLRFGGANGARQQRIPGFGPPPGFNPFGGQAPTFNANGTITLPNGQTFTPPTGGPGGGAFPGGGGGAAGGLLDAGTPDAALTKLLQQGASGYRWTAAAIGANSAAGYQLASGEPIMAIGGFNGSDPAPSLAQFQQYVAEHKIHYFLGGGGGFGPGLGTGTSSSSEISTWVQQHFGSTTVGGVTVYDLTHPTSSTTG